MWYIAVCVLVCAHAQEHSVNVATREGVVRGRKTSGRLQFVKFLGIPYGNVDDEDPFGAATPHSHIDTVYSAYNDPPICPQIVDGITQGNIHCLHLNIYTPSNVTRNSSLPVMVFIHGGGFIEGNGNFQTMSPIYFLEHNVIFVTINYRLGPYGFLCLPELGYSNQGLKDIVLALKWVKNNINNFGGDEENVLLFGHSAGSAAVEFLLLYNEEKLFDKVILQSMNIASPYMASGEASNEVYITTVAEKLGIDTRNIKVQDVIKQLSSINSDLLINITKGHEFIPCVDNTFITKSPQFVNMTDKSIMIGSTNKEIVFFYKGEETRDIDKFKEDLDKGFVNLPQNAIELVKDFYLTGDLKDNVIDFGTDYVFKYPAERSVRYYITNNATVYRYVFSHDGGRNYMKLRDNITEAGATHGDELGYLFDMDTLVTVPFDHEDSEVSAAMTEMWTNFAKYGNPTPSTSNHVRNIWLKVDKQSEYYMNISYTANFAVQEGPYRDRIDFWDAFYQQYGNKSKGFNFGDEYTRRRNIVSGLSQDMMRKMREFK